MAYWHCFYQEMDNRARVASLNKDIIDNDLFDMLLELSIYHLDLKIRSVALTNGEIIARHNALIDIDPDEYCEQVRNEGRIIELYTGGLYGLCSWIFKYRHIRPDVQYELKQLQLDYEHIYDPSEETLRVIKNINVLRSLRRSERIRSMIDT